MKLMLINFIIFFAISLAILNAGTVTLTGTCLLKGNNLTFSLINNGNESALNLIIQPNYVGVQGNSSYLLLRYLNPNQPYNITLPLKIYNKGSFLAYFNVTYEAGTNVYSAVFPCLLAENNSFGSFVYTLVNESEKNNNYLITVNLTNQGPKPINVSVYLLIPKTFSAKYVSTNITLYPNKNREVNFSFSGENGYNSFALGIGTYYVLDNKSYATLNILSIAPKNTKSDYTYIIAGGIFFIIAVLFGLYIRKIISKKINKS